MSKEGPTYNITKEWQDDVRAEMKRRGLSQNAFAREAGISTTSMHDILKEGAARTAYLPAVNKVLGWPIPTPFLTNDEMEMVEQYKRLDPMTRGRELERIRSKADELEQRGKRRR